MRLVRVAIRSSTLPKLYLKLRDLKWPKSSSACRYARTYIHVYIHAYVHTHTHTHTETHTTELQLSGRWLSGSAWPIG